MTGVARRFRRDKRGATAMEFALVAPVFLLLIMGIFDLGHIMLVDSMLHGAVEKAGRDSTLETGPANAAKIDARVRYQVQLAMASAVVTPERLAYQDFTNIGKPEPFVDDNANGKRDATECYEDINGSKTWDTDASTKGQGGASQVAVYRVTATFPHVFPMPALIGLVTRQPQNKDNVSLTASTVLRNQPYGVTAAAPAIICS